MFFSWSNFACEPQPHFFALLYNESPWKICHVLRLHSSSPNGLLDISTGICNGTLISASPEMNSWPPPSLVCSPWTLSHISWWQLQHFSSLGWKSGRNFWLFSLALQWANLWPHFQRATKRWPLLITCPASNCPCHGHFSLKSLQYFPRGLSVHPCTLLLYFQHSSKIIPFKTKFRSCPDSVLNPPAAAPLRQSRSQSQMALKAFHDLTSARPSGLVSYYSPPSSTLLQACWPPPFPKHSRHTPPFVTVYSLCLKHFSTSYQ